MPNSSQFAEQLIHTIVESAPIGAHLYKGNGDGRPLLSHANRSADSILRVRHQELIGRPFEEVVPALRQSEIPGALRRVLEIGEPAKFELPFEDGRAGRILAFHLVRVSPGLVSILFWDASAEKQLRDSEDKLREGEEQMQFILENVVDFIAVVDVEGRQLYNSPSYAMMFGDPAELRGRSIFEQVHPDERDRIIGIFSEAVRTGGTHLVEFRAVSQDGRTRLMQSQGRVFKDRAGKVRGAVIVSRDITEKRDFELERKLLYHAIEQSPSSIVITDSTGNIEYTNSKFTQITGYLSQEVIGKNPRFLKSGESSPAEYKQLWETIKSGKEWRGEFHNKKKDGTLFWESASISPITDTTGRITNFVAVKEDITERKALEAQLFRTQRLESLGTLAGGIAHDLNNVLSPILLAIEMLRKQHADEKSQHILSTLESSAMRGKNIIQQVLTFARGAEGTKAPMDIRHIVKEIQHISEETFPRNIHIQTSLPGGLWLVAGDLTQLHQVVMNLCVNARDAMPNGGILTIAAENMVLDEHYVQMHSEARVGPYVVVTITDTGVGIPKDIIDKIFDPFFSTKEVGKGTGLGLSTVHSIVKGHRGFTNVYSEVGRGTTFKVFLPAIPSAETAEAGEEGPYPMGDQEVVLIVDDEASICEITRRTLDSYGYRTMTASDGTEALAIYARNWDVIDVVLTDIMMPFVDGPALIRALRKIHPEVKIIGTSGLLDAGRIEEMSKLELQGFLRKPYKAELLLRTISSALGKKSS
ncbi:MAG TPA: PAS domain S-box protein [Bacteroidota bacterium]|nr:PAS domain S-box protein [Bacteroidota bacterium]